MSTLIIFLFVIIVLVVGHELGHFFVAKIFGVRVEEFGLGYPPRAKKLFTWRGTLFTLNWLPFGGFVKIFGEDDGGKSADTKSDSFSHQKLWKRLLILVAGITANIILAIILYSASFGIGFPGNAQDFPNAHVVSPQQLTIIEVVKDSPASLSGLQINDKVVSLTYGTDDVAYTPQNTTEFIQFIQSHSTETIHIEVLRNGDDKYYSVTPRPNMFDGKPGIGLGIDQEGTLRMSFFDAIKTGFVYTLNQFILIIVSLWGLIVGIFAPHSNALSQLSGPVGIAKFAGTAYSLGVGSLLSFMALISINLAVVNLLPFPALDGGRMILELFASKGKNKISQKIVAFINRIGFLVLIILMLWITYHDIFHPL
ncbi:MAG: M50 family metallopeptidase [bacterium]